MLVQPFDKSKTGSQRFKLGLVIQLGIILLLVVHILDETLEEAVQLVRRRGALRWLGHDLEGGVLRRRGAQRSDADGCHVSPGDHAWSPCRQVALAWSHVEALVS